MTKCRSCGAEIAWVFNAQTNTQFPAAPLAGRTLKTPRYTLHRQDGITMAYRDDDGLYISHFAECPNADKHRKGQR